MEQVTSLRKGVAAESIRTTFLKQEIDRLYAPPLLKYYSNRSSLITWI